MAVFGAGAIGGFIAAALTRSGVDVAVVARGAHLEAIRRRGLRVRSEIGDFTAHPRAANDLRDLGEFDYVLLTFKAHDWKGVLPQLGPALASGSAIVTLQNGFPFWFLPGDAIAAVDPGGRIARTIPERAVIGGVVHASGSLVEPGLVVQSGGKLYPIGELDGSTRKRTADLCAAFERAGLEAPVESDIRRIVWRKLLGNLAFNPVSALTGLTMGAMLNDAGTRRLLREIMEEGLAVARATGIEVGMGSEQRLKMSERTGDVKTSMLQDLEAGKDLEVEPIVGAVVELAQRFGVPAPRTQTLYALTKGLQARTRGTAV